MLKEHFIMMIMGTLLSNRSFLCDDYASFSDEKITQLVTTTYNIAQKTYEKFEKEHYEKDKD